MVRDNLHKLHGGIAPTSRNWRSQSGRKRSKMESRYAVRISQECRMFKPIIGQGHRMLYPAVFGLLIILMLATDGTSTANSVLLTLILTDVNDNSPQFNASSYTTTIYDTATAGTVILTIHATDADSSPTITYSITAGNAGNTFSIVSVSNTGQLSLNTPGNLNPPTTTTYTLTVQASDEGGNVNTTTVTINVVDDKCDPQPCKNGGTCNKNETHFACACANHWVGTTCSAADSAHGGRCNSDPDCTKTANAGTCKSSSCICDTGYSVNPDGSACISGNTDDPCIPNPCQNGGTCVVSGTTFNCSCTSSFQGSNCSKLLPTTEASTIPHADGALG